MSRYYCVVAIAFLMWMFEPQDGQRSGEASPCPCPDLGKTPQLIGDDKEGAPLYGHAALAAIAVHLTRSHLLSKNVSSRSIRRSRLET